MFHYRGAKDAEKMQSLIKSSSIRGLRFRACGLRFRVVLEPSKMTVHAVGPTLSRLLYSSLFLGYVTLYYRLIRQAIGILKKG